MTCKDKIFFANHKKKFQHFFCQPISCPPKTFGQVLFRPATGQFSQPKCRGENHPKTAISRHKTQANRTIKMTKWHNGTITLCQYPKIRTCHFILGYRQLESHFLQRSCSPPNIFGTKIAGVKMEQSAILAPAFHSQKTSITDQNANPVKLQCEPSVSPVQTHFCGRV